MGVTVAWFAQPFVHENDQAINVIVTVFSVLAGFLVAIIAIVGDPILLPPGTWRAAEMERTKVNDRLIRHKWLFILYLLTLGVIFLAFLFKEEDPSLIVWFERLFLFLGTVAFVLSMRLPGALMQVQRERIDAVIEYRRRADNIDNSSGK
jgi:hypothetical protein